MATVIGDAYVDIKGRDGGFRKQVERIADVGDIAVPISLDSTKFEKQFDALIGRVQGTQVKIEAVLDEDKLMKQIDGINDYISESMEKSFHVDLDLDVNTDVLDALVYDFEDHTMTSKVGLDVDFKSVNRAVKTIEAILDDHDFNVTVTVDAESKAVKEMLDDLHKPVEPIIVPVEVEGPDLSDFMDNKHLHDFYTRLYDFADEVDTQTVDFFIDLHTNRIDEKLDLLAHPRTVVYRPVLDRTAATVQKMLGSLAAPSQQMVSRVSQAVQSGDNPFIEWFRSPDIMNAMKGFGIATAGVVDPRAIRDKITAIMTDFEGIALNTGKAATQMGAMASAAGSAAGFAANMVSDIAQIPGLLAAAPAGFAFMKSVSATWGIAWKNMSKALQYDTESAMKEIAKMPPMLQQSATQLHEFSRSFQDVITMNYWGIMLDDLDLFIEKMQLPLNLAFGNLAKGLAFISEDIVKLILEFEKSGDFFNTFTNFGKTLSNLRPAIRNIVDTLLDMINAGSNRLPEFAKWIAQVSRKMHDWMEGAIDTGKFDMWIDNAVDRIQELASIVGDVTGIMGTLGKAADQAGSGGLTELAEGFGKVREAMGEPDTYMNLVGIFRDANTAFSQITKGAETIVGALGDKSRELGDILIITSETVGTLLEHIGGALENSSVVDGLHDLVEGVRGGMDQMGPGIESLGNIVGTLMTMFGALIESMAPGLNIMLGTLDGFLANMAEGWIPLNSALNDAFELITKALSGPIQGFGTLLGNFAEALAMIPTPLLAMGIMLGGLVGPGGLFVHFINLLTGSKFRTPLKAFIDINSELGTTSTRMQKLEGRIGFLTTAFARTGREASRSVSGINDAVSRNFAGVRKAGTGIFDRVKSEASQLYMFVDREISPIQKKVESLKSKGKGTFDGLKNSAIGVDSFIGREMIVPIKEEFNSVKKAGSNIFSGVSKSTAGIRSSFREDVVIPLSKGFDQASSGIRSSIQNHIVAPAQTGFRKAKTAGSMVFDGIIKTGKTVPGIFQRIGAAGSAAFGMMMGPVGMVVTALGGFVFTKVIEGIQQAKASVEEFTDSWDPITQSVTDVEGEVRRLNTRFEEMRPNGGFDSFTKTLQDAGINVDDFAERLVKLDTTSLNNVKSNLGEVADAISNNFNPNRQQVMRDAIAKMSDETVRLTGRTREELEKMNFIDFNELISGMGEIAGEAINGRDAAETFKEALDSLNTGNLTLISDSFADFATIADQGVRDALVRANEQAGTLDENFRTLESTTSSVSQKIAAMQSNMELMNLDTSMWNDPMERLWKNSKDTGSALEDLKKKMDGLDPTKIVSITEGFDGAKHATFNFSKKYGEASSLILGMAKDSSSAIKEAYIAAFDQARDSGESMTGAMDSAFKAVKPSIDNLKKSLTDIGIPEEDIQGILDTYGILETDLETSININGAEEAKRDLVEVELTAQAITSENWEAFLRFNATDAKNGIRDFVGESAQLGDIAARLTLEGADEAQAYLTNLSMSDNPVKAFLDLQTETYDEKKKWLEEQKVRIETALEGASGDDYTRLKTEQQQVLDGMEALKLQVEGDTKKVPEQLAAVKQGVESETPALFGVHLNKAMADSDVSDLEASVGQRQATMGLGLLPGPFFTGVDQAVATAETKKAGIPLEARTDIFGAQTAAAIGAASQSTAMVSVEGETSLLSAGVDAVLSAVGLRKATLPVDANTAPAEQKLSFFDTTVGQWVSTMKVDGDTSLGQQKANAFRSAISLGPAASMGLTTDNTQALNNVQGVRNNASSVAALMNIEGNIGGVTNKMAEATAIANQGASFPVNVDSTPVNNLFGLIDTNRSKSVNVSTSAPLDNVISLISTIMGIPAPTVPIGVATAEAVGKVVNLSDLINSVPDETFDISTNPAEALENIKYVVAQILGVPDTDFDIDTDIRGVLDKIARTVTEIVDIPNKEFSIRAAASQAMQAIREINGATIWDKTMTVIQKFRSAKMADGGIIPPVRKYANGGIDKSTTQSIKAHAFAGGTEKHVAQIARGAYPYRVWAEPETGGEAYIPLAKAKRQRSMEILEQVARHFGYSLVQKFSAGGVFASTVRKRGVQKFASGGTTLGERRQALAADLESIFRAFASSMESIFQDKKSPVVEGMKTMSKALTEAIAANGSSHSAMRDRARGVRRQVDRNGTMSNFWRGGVNAGLDTLARGINSNGTQRKGSNFTLADLEAGISRTQTRLEDAMRNAEGLRQSYVSTMDTISKAAREPFSLSNAFSFARDTYTPVSLKMVTDHAKKIISNNKTFGSRLSAMAAKGFPAAFIHEVASLGAEEGIKVADELLKSSPGDVKQFNQVYAEVDRSSNALGKQVAGAMYNHGIAAADGVVAGLQARLSELEKAGQLLSTALVNSFKKALGIKSPSRVMMGLAGFVGEGLTIGIADQVSGVQSAMSLISDAVASADIPPVSIPDVAIPGSSAAQARVDVVRSADARNNGTMVTSNSAGNTYVTFEAGSVTVDANDLDEVKRIEDFLHLIRNESRRKGVRG